MRPRLQAPVPPRQSLTNRHPLPPRPKPAHTTPRTPRLPDHPSTSRAIRTTVAINAHARQHARRQTGHRRHPAPVVVGRRVGVVVVRAEIEVLAEEGAEATGGATRGRGDGGVAFANVAVGGARGETGSLRVQRLHVWHGFLHAEGLSHGGGGREVG